MKRATDVHAGQSSSTLSLKDSFCYNQDTVNYVEVGQDLSIRVGRTNNNVARVYLVDGPAYSAPCHHDK